MSFLKKIDKYLSKVEAFLLSYTVIAMAIVLIGNVLSRSIFNRSWTFVEEVGQLMVIIITFVGVSYAARNGRHIRMSAVFDAVPMKVKKVLILIISLVTAITLLYFAYLGFTYMQFVMGTGRVTPALRIPAYFMVVFVPVGFLLAGIQYLINFVLNLREKEIYIGTDKPLALETQCSLETKCNK